MPPANAYHALLASRIVGLEDVRARIWEQGQIVGAPVWVSEIDARDRFLGKDLDFIQAACLKQVRSAPKFICLIDGTYGRTSEWTEGQISILELEIATAAFSKRDTWIFLLAPYDDPDPRIKSLLKSIEISCPQGRIRGPLPQKQVLAEVSRILEAAIETPDVLKVSPLVADLARKRSPSFNFNLSLNDVQFLGSTFSALAERRPDKDQVTRLLVGAEQEASTPDKLAKVWVAIRHLSGAPFTEQKNDEYLPLWERALEQWARASAWYGLHGHFMLGRLAAVNTLSNVRIRMPARMRKDIGPPSIFASAGAAASEYYSIAKLLSSPWQRHRMLGKALWNCNAALREKEVSDLSGLLDIRGHIKLRMFNPLGAVSDLRHALEIRRDTNQSLARIGESEMHLGAVYAQCGLRRLAEPLLEQGVAKLHVAGSNNFLVQGLRHLAAFYGRSGRTADAADALQKAQDIAQRLEIAGQLQQIVKDTQR